MPHEDPLVDPPVAPAHPDHEAPLPHHHLPPELDTQPNQTDLIIAAVAAGLVLTGVIIGSALTRKK